jgi:flagellar motor protein MotB
MTEDTDLREAMRTVRGTWRIWTLLALTIAFGGFGAFQLYSQREAALRDLAGADSRATQKQAELVLAEQSRAALDQRVKRLEEENRVFAAYKAELDATARAGEALQAVFASIRGSLDEKNKAEILAGTIKLEAHTSTFAISFADKVLFDGDSVTLSKNGSDTLARIAGLLAGGGDRRIRIESSFDGAERPRPPFAGNWELYAARAGATARFLREKTPVGAGVVSIEAGPNAPRAHRIDVIVFAAPGDALRSGGTAVGQSPPNSPGQGPEPARNPH